MLTNIKKELLTPYPVFAEKLLLKIYNSIRECTTLNYRSLWETILSCSHCKIIILFARQHRMFQVGETINKLSLTTFEMPFYYCPTENFYWLNFLKKCYKYNLNLLFLTSKQRKVSLNAFLKKITT